MITLALFAALAFLPQENSNFEEKTPIAPEQVLAWQLEGLTQEEIRDEVGRRGLTECAEEPLLHALSAAHADIETVRAVRSAKAPCKLWKLDLRLPRPTDYLYEVAGAEMWGDWDHALQTIEMEVGEQPRDPDARLIYAHLLTLSEDWITAYGEVTEAEALAPRSPYTRALRSTICYHSGLLECALRESNVFLRMRPEDAWAYILLGQAKELQGHDDEARVAYNEARRLHEGYAQIFAGLGRVYARAAEFEKAAAAVRNAIRLDGREAEYYVELAQICDAEERWHEAIENWTKAKELQPRPGILLALGKAYAANKQYGAAVREYQELLQMAPDTAGAKEELVKVLRLEGREEEARKVEEQRDPL